MRAFTFERVRRADDGPLVHAAVLVCCKCGKRLELVASTRERMPPEFIKRQAANRGWKVGKDDKSDLCPEHHHPHHTKEPKMKPTKTLAELSGVVSLPAFAATPEPPRTMSNDDRRIIFAKVDEVYSGDHYSAGWTDKRVAEDLNVPRAWVEEVRAEFFGEARDNEEVRAFLDEIDKLKPALATFATDRQEMLKRVEDLAGKVSRLLKIGEEIRKSLAS